MAHEATMKGGLYRRQSPEQWRLATQAITASCAVTSARAWIGYIPQGLIEDAQDALRQLPSQETATGMPLFSSQGALPNLSQM